MKTLDRSRDFGLRYGSNDGSAYFQDGALFDFHGNEVIPPTEAEPNMEAAPLAPEAATDIELEAERPKIPEEMTRSELMEHLDKLGLKPRPPFTTKMMLKQLRDHEQEQAG